MDVNGTRFHLIKGEDGWIRHCRELDTPEPSTRLLEPLETASGSPLLSHVYWDDDAELLTLRPQLSLFRPQPRSAPLSPSARRGAARDRFGNWYWIGRDRRTLFWMPEDAQRPIEYWIQAPPEPPARPGEFHDCVEEPRLVVDLAGLTITEHHYLVVGNVTQHGLLLFDLHKGGEPVRLLFPPEVPFEPFDLAPAPGGGLWVLDRQNRTYWGLDRHFRVLTTSGSPAEIQPHPAPTFQPVEGAPLALPGRKPLHGFPLLAQNPISIEAGPDGSVLILDSPALTSPPVSSAPPSRLLAYQLGQMLWDLPLEGDLEVYIEGEGTVISRLSVVGYDMALTGPPEQPVLMVVEANGKQTLAFSLYSAASPPRLKARYDYLPLHFFGGRGLVTAEGEAYYDVAAPNTTSDTAIRWVPLHALDEPPYSRRATLLTPIFDGKERDCVWHRLFLDACIPAETSVTVWSRATNEKELLESVPFTPEPSLYRRGAGAEVPFYDPFPEFDPRPAHVGTWELLFQQPRGRYLQLRLDLEGNGRVTPALRALRAYYPRFSYPRQYLPGVYQEEDRSTAFLERLLANLEGFYTETEGKIRGVGALFDGRSASPEALDWLAGWLGLVVDPLWAGIQKQRAPSKGERRRAVDRRRLFIRYARKLYERRGTPDGIRFALHLLLDPCLESTLHRLKAIAAGQVDTLSSTLERHSLPTPTSLTSDDQLEDLLFALLLHPDRPSNVRLVERFRTRGGRTAVEGDLSGEAAETGAHRFSVMILQDLSSAESAMVERIVALEKPAHTYFDVRRYWAHFRIGEARVGLETILGEESRYLMTVLGRTRLSEGYLHPLPPTDAPDRLLADRDRVGRMPPL